MAAETDAATASTDLPTTGSLRIPERSSSPGPDAGVPRATGDRDDLEAATAVSEQTDKRSYDLTDRRSRSESVSRWQPRPSAMGANESLTTHAAYSAGSQPEPTLHDSLLAQDGDAGQAGDSQHRLMAYWKGSTEYFHCTFIWYCRQVVRCPCFMIFVYLACFGFLIWQLWRPFELEEDFSAFIKADGRAQREREAYIQALDEKSGFSARRRLQEDRVSHAGAFKTHQFARLRPACNETGTFATSSNSSEVEMDESGIPVLDSWPNMDPDMIPLDDSGTLFMERPRAPASGTEGAAGRRLASRVFTKKELTILYVAKNGDALDERVLRVQRDLEMRLRSLSGWQEFCKDRGNAALVYRCDPGVSLAAFAWPTEEVPDSTGYNHHKLLFDAYGSNPLPRRVLLAFMKDANNAATDYRRYFSRGFTLPDVGTPDSEVTWPQALRTKYTFHILVSGATAARWQVASLTGVNDDYEKFIIDQVYPILSESRDGSPARVFYEGDVITGYEIEHTLWNDLKWAIGSITFVYIYMCVHTKRPFLSLCCMLIIFAAVPVGYVLTPAAKTTIASFLSVFLITGVGSDVVFVFTDFWEQSIREHGKPGETHLRVAFMISHAGKSCLATSLTTAVSFFANLASALQPLREFGLFMGLCVMGAYVLVLLLLPPLIMLRCCTPVDDSKVAPETAAESGGGVRDTEALAISTEVQPPTNEPEDENERSRPIIQLMLFNFMNFLSRPWHAQVVVVLTAIACICFAIGIGLKAELDQGVPEIFPEDHNQVQVDDWGGNFVTVTDLTTWPYSSAVSMCTPNVSRAVAARSDCKLFWCEAQPMLGLDGAQGACWRNPHMTAVITDNQTEAIEQPEDDFKACSSVTWHARASTGAAAMDRSAWARKFQPYADSYLETQGISSPDTNSVSQSATELRALSLEDWEAGEVDVSRFFQMGDAKTSLTKTLQAPIVSVDCIVDVLCYFDTPACTKGDWLPMGPLTLTSTTTPADTTTPAPAETTTPVAGTTDPPRRLQDDSAAGYGLVTGTVPANKRVDVTVVWGLKPPLNTPLVGQLDELWSFDEGFRPQNPWSQRAIAAMCDEAQLPTGLQVVAVTCWIDKFRQDVQNNGDRFPTRNFDERLQSWFPSTTDAASNIWIVDGVMAASKLSFDVNVADDKSSAKLLDYKREWDNYVSSMNSKAALSAKHAFHTAEVWVRAEAEEAIVASTVETIILASLCAFLGVLCFTKDPWIALMVLVLVLTIISGLAFFMVVIMGWKIGPVEVIALVVFVGYSVTYSLHIAHNFAEVKKDAAELMLLEAEAQRREENRRRRKEGLPELGPDEPFEESSSLAVRQESPRTQASEDAGVPSPATSSNLGASRRIMNETGSTIHSSPRRLSAQLRSLQRRSLSAEQCSSTEQLTLTAAQMRRARTRVAVLHVGGATLSSACSTLGCSVFLLFCTLTIFDKLGTVVIAVTTLSIVFALVALPATLMVAGPTRPFSERFKEMFACVWKYVAKGRELLRRRRNRLGK